MPNPWDSDPILDGGAAVAAPWEQDPATATAAPWEADPEIPGAVMGQVNTLRRGIKQTQQLGQVFDVLATDPGQSRVPELEAQLAALERELADPATTPGRRGAIERVLAVRRPGLEKARTHDAQLRAQHGATATRALGRFGELQREIEAIPESPDVEQYRRERGTGENWEALKTLLANPVEIPTNIVAGSLPQSAPSLVGGVAGGLAAGPAGTAAGVGLGSFATEYLNTIVAELAAAKVDLRDQEALLRTVSDPAFLAKARAHGVRRGIPVAAFDALTAGFAGRFLRAARQGGTSMVRAGVKEAGAQAAGGAAGEMSAQIVSGERIDPMSGLEEALGELVPGVGEVATNYLRGRTPPPATPLGEANPAPSAPAGSSGERPARAVPPGEASPASLDELLAATDKTNAAAQQRQAQEATARETRQRAADEKRAALGRALALARQADLDYEATPGQLQAAVTTLRAYVEDNSLGIGQEERDAALALLARLEPRHEAMQASEKERRDAAEEIARRQAADETAARKRAIQEERARIREERAAGIGASGEFEYETAPTPALETRAENGDERAQAELVRREETAQLEDNAGDDLLSVLRQVRLPSRDTGGLNTELQELLSEGMNFGQRRSLTRAGAGSLDAIATTLRADHGFSQIQTPADLLDALGAALRGERVRPQRGSDFAERVSTPGRRDPSPAAAQGDAMESPGVDFASAARRSAPLTTGIRPEVLAKPVAPVAVDSAAYQASNRANRARLLADPTLVGTVRNADTGAVLNVRRSTYQHAFTAANGPEAHAILAQTLELARRAVLIWESTENAPGDARRVQRYLGAVTSGARTVPVRLTVIERATGEMQVYDVQPLGHKKTLNIQAPGKSDRVGPDAQRTATVGELLPGVKAEADGTASAEFAQEEPDGPALPADLTPRRRDRIWRAMQRAVPNLTEQVDIEIALSERELGERLAAEGTAVDAERLSRIDAAMIPAEARAARAHKDAIILAAHVWQSWRTGAQRLVHEVAHVFWYALPAETRTALRALHRHEVTGRTGPLYVDGKLHTELAHVEELTELGAREWFAERMAALNGAHLHRELRRASGPLGRAEMLLRDAWEQFVEILRAVFETDVRRRLHQDPHSEFWQGEFQRFLAGGARADARTRATATAYAEQLRAPRSVEFAERGPAAADALAIMEGELAGMQAAYTTAREKFEAADAAVRQAETDLAALQESNEDEADLADRGRALQARLKGAQALRSAHYAAATAARDRVQVWEDRIRLHKANARDVAQDALKGAPNAPAADARVSEYRDLDQEAESIERELRRTEKSNERRVIRARAQQSKRLQEIRTRQRELGQELDADQPGWRANTRGATAPAPVAERQPGEDEPTPFPPAQEQTITPAKFLEVEGHGLADAPGRAQTLARRIAEFARGFAGSLPELPTFARAWWNRTDPFLRGDGAFYNRLQEGFRLLKRSDAGVLKEAAERVERVLRELHAARGRARFPADDYARLRTLQARVRSLREDQRPVPATVTAEIQRLNDQLERDPYVLFSRLVMYLDFRWRKTNLKDSQGNAISLPGNLNLTEVEGRLADLRAKVAASPQAAQITEALRRHVDLVRTVAADLQARDLMAQAIATNPYYFPHLVVDRTSGRIEGIRLQTADEFRGYLINPVGSAQPVETDYARAMYYHLAQVGAHNRRADVVREYFKPYDIRARLVKEAQAASRARGVTVTWRQIFFERYRDDGYVMHAADPGGAIVPALEISRDRLAQRIGAMIGEGDLHKELERLGVAGIRVLPEDIRESLHAGEKEYWVVPAKVSEALKGMERRAKEKDHLGEQILAGVQQVWKKNILFAPWNWVRYEFNNLAADLEKVFSTDPAMVRQFGRALKDLRALKAGGELSPELRQALKLGVLESVTAAEIGAVPEVREFDFLATDRQRVWHWIRRHNTVRASAWREALFRYSKFLADVQRIEKGARPVYSGAYWRNIEAMQESAPGAGDAAYLKAAEITKKTFGDYDDLTVSGEKLRRLMIPFYSWTEINFKYHANLFRNLRDALLARDITAAQAAGAGGRAAAALASTITRKAAGMFLTRLALPYVAILAWNSTGDRKDIEDELSDEDKRRFHIVIGRRADGRAMVIYAPTALSDVLRWFSGPEFARVAVAYTKGQMDLPTALGEWTERLYPDFLNNTVGSLGPVVKVPIMLMSGQQYFPDVTEPRAIPKYDLRRVILGNMTDQFTADMIERLVGQDYVPARSLGDWAMQTILQVRQRDAEQWAFYAIKDKANDFLEQRTGTSRSSDYDAPDQQVLRNFRRAIYRGDAATAVRMYDRLLAYGYTAERFSASVRAQDPLSVLGKQGAAGNLRQEFVDGLSDYEQAMLERAFRFYGRMTSFRGDERRLFPRRGRTPRESELRARRFRPRPELIEQEIEAREQIPQSQIDRQIEMDLRRSLRVMR